MAGSSGGGVNESSVERQMVAARSVAVFAPSSLQAPKLRQSETSGE